MFVSLNGNIPELRNLAIKEIAFVPVLNHLNKEYILTLLFVKDPV
jgi:hypothetical protein